MSGFDRISFFYDFLARLVFGKSIVAAQEYYLEEIKDGDRILILGGGTGWILNSIYSSFNPKEVWFVDASSKMIQLAKERLPEKSNILFVNSSFQEIPINEKFDIIITNFFLDVFSNDELQSVCQHILTNLTPEGILLCTDFLNTGKWMNRVMLKVMYFFFKLTAGLQTDRLPEWEEQLCLRGAVLQKEKKFLNGFIKTTVFRKKSISC